MDFFDSIAIEFDLSDRTLKKISLQNLPIDLQDTNKLYWVHCNLDQQELFKNLIQQLPLPENVVDLCSLDNVMPKLIDSDDNLTVRIECLQSNELQLSELKFSPLIMHLTNRFCFTASSEALPLLTEFLENSQKAVRYAKTPCFILFLMLDMAVNDYAKILFDFELETDEMDLRVHTMQPEMYTHIVNVKHQVMRVKRYIIAIREILMRISGRHIAVISEQCRASLHNLSNHTHMVVNEIDSLRDILSSMLNQMDNALMQKMSGTMRVLTAFAAVFLPLSLITGIYGMNFHWMPELDWKYGYFYALGLISFCGFGLLFIFKKMKWF